MSHILPDIALGNALRHPDSLGPADVDNLLSDSELTFHDLFRVFQFVEPVVPALHALGCGVGNGLPSGRPSNLIPLALHQGDEVFPGRCEPHTLVDGIHEPEFPALALGGRAILPGVHPLLLDLLLRRWKDRQMVGGADLIVGQPVGLQVGGTLVELLTVLEAHTVHHKVVE